MKYVVQGNCQSRPISIFMAAACPMVEILEPVVTQLQSDATFDEDYEKFSSADLIFAQWVSDDYRVQHLATSRLKAEFGDKVVSWPNAFFTGQSPDVVSIATKSKPRVIGPLDTYHLRSVFNSWLSGESAETCIEKIENTHIQYPQLISEVEKSLNELKKRESLLDIGISDFIERYWLEKKLFHVFNHPTNTLLVELVWRLLEFAEINNSVPIMADFWPEYLNHVIAPGIPAMNRELGVTYGSSTSSKGFLVNKMDTGVITIGGVNIYSMQSLVETFYMAYDSQLSSSDDFSFTPLYLQSEKPLSKVA